MPTIEFVITFSILSIIDVMLSTMCSIITVNSNNKIFVAFFNGFYNSLYNIILIMIISSQFSIINKCIVIFASNFIGVYVVKLLEEKFNKDKSYIYIVSCKENNRNVNKIYYIFKEASIKSIYSEIITDNLYSMQIFSSNNKESKIIESVLNNFNVSYHIVEDVKKHIDTT